MNETRGLLVDQNLSPRVARALGPWFERVVHVREVSLKASSDSDLWVWAKTNGLAILTKDSDFHQRSFALGHPPKVIWVRIGNASTAGVISLLESSKRAILDFCVDPDSSFLVLEP